MNNNKTLIWAQGVEANVKEPIEALKEHGWCYGDVPAASNFNWLFKTMTEELAILRKDLLVQKEDFTNALLRQEENITEKFNGKITRVCKQFIRLSQRQHEWEDRLWNIYEFIRGMEQLIRHYHPTFPEIPWPALPKPKDSAIVNEDDILA